MILAPRRHLRHVGRMEYEDTSMGINTTVIEQIDETEARNVGVRRTSRHGGAAVRFDVDTCLNLDLSNVHLPECKDGVTAGLRGGA
jgi:hypothetical protein